MLCKCQHCNSPFEASRRTARFCSEACKKAFQRKGKTRVRLTNQQKLSGSGFVQFLVTHVKRSGSLSVLPAKNDQPAWDALYKLYARAQMFNFSLPDGICVHLSHYCPASSNGRLHPRNVGVWPSSDNLEFSSKSMPYGLAVSSDYMKKGKLLCDLTTANVRRLILVNFTERIANVAPVLPLTPITQAVKKLMTTTGQSFDSLFKLSRLKLHELFEQHNIDPYLDATLNRLTSDAMRTLLMTTTSSPLIDFIDMSKAELLTLLKKHGVTKDMMTPAVFTSTLSDVYRTEAHHQLAEFENRPPTGDRGRQAITDLRTFANLASRIPDDTIEPWLECGKFAITGRATLAIQTLNRLLAQRQVMLLPVQTECAEDPESCIELDDGTRIFEVITGRPSDQLNSDQLYTWYCESPHYDREKSLTGATIRTLYDKGRFTNAAA